MKRRDLFTGLFATSAFALSNGWLWKYASDNFNPQTTQDPLVLGDISDNESVVQVPIQQVESSQLATGEPPVGTSTVLAEQPLTIVDKTPTSPQLSTLDAKTETKINAPTRARAVPESLVGTGSEDHILEKVRNFESEFADDIYLSEDERIIMHSVLARLGRAEAFIGHGNYNIASFDYLLNVAERYPQVGAFSPIELDFMERVFFADATRYGFMGEKVTDKLTQVINSKDVVKIRYSGQYVFRGHSEVYYQKLKQDIGDSIILTSGIRGNVKQMHLFLAKAAVSNHNLSKASRSLAPPGHSFHGVGDFDVGKLGWGIANFSDQFAMTDEYKRMQDLGYVQIRYTQDNRLGVRFEPWHIKVV